MAFTLVAKVVTTLVVLAVIGGMTATIILVVNDANDSGPETTTATSPTDATDPTSPASPTEGPETTPGIVDDSVLYEVGVGIADMTGPCVEINFMGYAEVSQSGQGLHLRQFARSFIFKRGDTRVVLVTAEVQSVGIAVRREVVKKLQEQFGDMYSLRNVIITGTHTHAAPGGHLVDFILDISILGFSQETFNAYVEGITRSIVRAHENIVPARLFYAQTKVANAHRNRSPYSYEANPEEERMRYDGDTDDTLTQVRIQRPDGSLLGVMNWFAVHTTSMNMTNHLVSSDNLGYAALRMEKELNPITVYGRPKVVAGFFSSNLGDVSPNTRDPRCEFSGKVCDNQYQICEHLERCYAQGPGEDMFESTRIIGTKVFEGAWTALNSPAEELTGELGVVHQFVDMPEQVVAKYDPVAQTFNTDEPVKGCFAAMGYSFASGTIDGANTLNITQGTLEANNPLLELVSGVVAEPTPEDIECHAPKPILFATGRANFPLPWHPRIISVSLLWLCGLAVLGVPAEPTTMAGRRMRAVAASVMEGRGVEPRVVVSGLTNEYIHYVATPEEYMIQRYEAASTLYGPNTLDIFLNKFHEFTVAAIEGTDVEAGPEPADHRDSTLSLITPVVFDVAPIGRNFGDCLQQPEARVKRGDLVRATFVAANPRNDLKQEATHAAVQRYELTQWVDYVTDADWDTKFIWTRVSTLLGTSQVTFEWRVPEDALLAPYRLVYYGASRSVLGTVTPFMGASNSFNLD
ncbi:unnamed protein product [Chrysodeixis includens]|uniref:Neutral ceramidase n=1 Tax=Chrysodeixis includens TaxID=689277 RepID=A0A9P0FRS2_CHRIL|nr:unnamed protein product [Chrysodeixis includens]